VIKGVFSGTFLSDQICGEGDWERPHGERWTGWFEGGSLHGPGSISREDGFLEEGVFREGVLEGAGLRRCEAYEYTGEFERGRRHGSGQCLSKGEVFPYIILNLES